MRVRRVFVCTEDTQQRAVMWERNDAGGTHGVEECWCLLIICHVHMQYLLKGVQITSMDPNPDVAVYGSSYKHAVDFLQNIGKYAAPETFDIAVVNGVIGYEFASLQLH